MHRGTVLAVAVGVSVLVAAPGAQAVELQALGEDGKLHGWYAQFELGVSILSDAKDNALLQTSFGYAFKGGYRWSGWGVLLLVEHNNWMTSDLSVGEVLAGAVNIGIGAELTYYRGRIRTSLALGPSILAFDTALDPAGTVGLFLEFRPVGLRWPIHEYLAVGVDPISFALVAPVLSGIPLIRIQYRTSVYLEGAF